MSAYPKLGAILTTSALMLVPTINLSEDVSAQMSTATLTTTVTDLAKFKHLKPMLRVMTRFYWSLVLIHSYTKNQFSELLLL
jgi:hypothetical protein